MLISLQIIIKNEKKIINRLTVPPKPRYTYEGKTLDKKANIGYTNISLKAVCTQKIRGRECFFNCFKNHSFNGPHKKFLFFINTKT